MITTVHSNNLTELRRAIIEAEELSSKPQISKRDEHRLAVLLSRISLLKQGVSTSEIVNAEAERLAQDAGIGYLPAPADDAVNKEWRAIGEGKAAQVLHAVRHEVQPLKSAAEFRAATEGGQSITAVSGPAGAFFVPIQFHPRITAAMKQYDQIFDPGYCNVLETEAGGPITLPLLDDVSNESVQVSENTQSSSASDVTAGVMQLQAYSFRSKIIYVSLELFQDTSIGVPIGAILEAAFSVRHARGVGKAMVNGSGVSAPQGLVTGAVAAGNVVVAAGSAANTGNNSETGADSIGSKDLTSVWHALNPAYRPRAAWYLNADTLQSLDGLLDKNGRPIVKYRDGLYTLYGRPIALCPSMDGISASKNSIVVADPAYFYQRRIVRGSYVRRWTQSQSAVERGMIGFEGWYRTDSGLAVPNATYPPAAVLQQHS